LPDGISPEQAAEMFRRAEVELRDPVGDARFNGGTLFTGWFPKPVIRTKDDEILFTLTAGTLKNQR
jgi:hypothetical protein